MPSASPLEVRRVLPLKHGRPTGRIAARRAGAESGKIGRNSEKILTPRQLTRRFFVSSDVPQVVTRGMVNVQDTVWRPPAPVSERATPQRRVPALDGIRALAIVAVLFYHADLPWARGGFLGVDVFFVLSGFLITGLLVGEHSSSGRIGLKRFYARRARRLLPALFTVLAGVCLYVVLALPHEAAAYRGDAAAALGYVTNWWLILRGQSYFGGTGRPSLLINLWSLAVEEQFYLLWPPILRAMLSSRAARRRGGETAALWRALLWTIALAALSALAMK